MSLEGWDVEELDDLVDDTTIGLVRNKKQQGEGLEFPYIKMNNIGNDNEFDPSSIVKVDASPDEVEQYRLEDGDLLFNTRNSHELVGKSCLYRRLGHNSVLFNNNIMRIRFADRITPKFAAYAFNSTPVVSQLKAMVSGTTNVAGIYYKSLKHLRLPVPPKAEQKRIVSILDEAFSAIAKAKENAEKNLLSARELFESYLNRVFTQQGPGWQETTVADVARKEKGSMRTGPFGSQLLHSEFVDEGIAVLGIDNAVHNEFRWGKRRFITDEKYEGLTRYTVKPGDVIITIMGTNGRCAVIPDDIPVAINSKHLCCITLDQKQCLPQYLHVYFLHHPVALEFLRRRAKGAVFKGLNMGIIKELPLMLPGLDMQRDIARYFVELRSETVRLETIYTQKLANLDELKQSLLQKAFTGQLTAAAVSEEMAV